MFASSTMRTKWLCMVILFAQPSLVQNHDVAAPCSRACGWDGVGWGDDYCLLSSHLQRSALHGAWPTFEFQRGRREGRPTLMIMTVQLAELAANKVSLSLSRTPRCAVSCLSPRWRLESRSYLQEAAYMSDVCCWDPPYPAPLSNDLIMKLLVVAWRRATTNCSSRAVTLCVGDNEYEDPTRCGA